MWLWFLVASWLNFLFIWLQILVFIHDSDSHDHMPWYGHSELRRAWTRVLCMNGHSYQTFLLAETSRQPLHVSALCERHANDCR